MYGNNKRKRKSSSKTEWYEGVSSSDRIALVNFIVELIPGSLEVVRKKLGDLMVQSKTLDDFAQSVAEFVRQRARTYSVDYIKGMVLDKLGFNSLFLTEEIPLLPSLPLTTIQHNLLQQLPSLPPPLSIPNSLFDLSSDPLDLLPGTITTPSPNSNTVRQMPNRRIPSRGIGTSALSMSSYTSFPDLPPSNQNSGLVVRGNEFNSLLFENFVERNKRVSQAVNVPGMNIEELMEQYRHCTKLAKLWIVQDLITRNELSLVCGDEWKDSILLSNLPFDLKCEIITFIPTESFTNCWWIQYLRLRIISKSMKSRLEETLFSRMTNEGIDLSVVMSSQLSNFTIKGILSLLSTHAEYVRQGNQFSGDFLIPKGVPEEADTDTFQLLSKKGLLSMPKFNGNTFRSKLEENQSIDYSKSFDHDYMETLVTMAAKEDNTSYNPFQQHVAAINDITTKQNGLVMQLQTAFRQPEQEFTSLEINNPFIKSLTISLNRTRNNFITDILTNLEELTIIVALTDFTYPFSQLLNNINHLKLKKLNIVCYDHLPTTLFHSIEGRLDLLDFGGTISLYADIDEGLIHTASLSNLPITILLGDKIIKSTLDFKNLTFSFHPIRDFNVTKYIFEKGWYRKIDHSITRIAPLFTSIENNKKSTFPFSWFNADQIKELLKYFVYGNQFPWYETPSNQLDESIIQYYLHMLNVNQKRLRYSEPKDCSAKILNMIVWGYDISLCPELILTNCTNFGNIGRRLVIEKLKLNPNYINVDKIRALMQSTKSNTNALYCIVQLIPYIQNNNQIFESYLLNGKKTNALLSIIFQPTMLAEYVFDNFVSISNIESDVEVSGLNISMFSVILSSPLPNRLVLKLATSNPKLLVRRNSDGNIPLHYCFGSPKRYVLIKPFLELAPDTLDYEDKNGYKPYHLIPECLEVQGPRHQTGIDLGMDFFQTFILPDVVKDRLKEEYEAQHGFRLTNHKFVNN
ncbi:hypothetical protein NAEGRDRAFT_74467 [Naegleria gruberi]|uniref:Uncharacterized protein n=1 Tax=Naegleria gruberi TaxID=5762 RepID=D2VZF0_NAEGR|nr:uncharacterized protein NAEGRDRAFT_74467 [Naegleria gruberi]EFC37781.1 hypothetical protein NAEGRDRAFT_74467 [Naegleria gruberi]|eukprot:XP_002670525.1 hypothetical protein NAEGRDRAFT_74467 [Naegleria gruberi strain NEG-M]